jgi:hypothetical protein
MMRLKELGHIEKYSDLIGNRTSDLPACSIVPQPTTPELHKIPARVQCTVKCADWIDEPAPPTIP